MRKDAVNKKEKRIAPFFFVLLSVFLGMSSIFLGGSFSRDIDIEKSAYYASEIVKKQTINKEYLSVAVNRKDKTDLNVERGHCENEFNNLYGIFAESKVTFAPVYNPSAYITINSAIQNDVQNVAAGYLSPSGDVFAGDGRAAVEIAAIRNTSIMVGSMKTFDDFFADSVTNVGLKGEQAETNHLSQAAIMDDLRNMRESISGVNIDEELAEIMKFQHGYNAAAKFITVWDSLIDTIINRLGV